MWRRLYLNFPTPELARRLGDELQQAGIKREQIHAMGRDGTEVEGLPPLTEEQRRDRVWFWEQLYWNSNLVIFGIALLGFIVAMFYGSGSWMLLTAAIMLLTFLTGKHFATEVPHAHLNSEMSEPMHHGEVVVMVDMPQQDMARVEEIAHHHRQAGGNVVGWSMPMFGL